MKDVMTFHVDDDKYFTSWITSWKDKDLQLFFEHSQSEFICLGKHTGFMLIQQIEKDIARTLKVEQIVYKAALEEFKKKFNDKLKYYRWAMT